MRTYAVNEKIIPQMVGLEYQATVLSPSANCQLLEDSNFKRKLKQKLIWLYIIILPF
jgi:hypothetical protein